MTTSNTTLELADVIVNGVRLDNTSTPDSIFNFNIQPSIERLVIRLDSPYQLDSASFWDHVHVLSLAHGSAGRRHTVVTVEPLSNDTEAVNTTSATILVTALGDVLVEAAEYYDDNGIQYNVRQFNITAL